MRFLIGAVALSFSHHAMAQEVNILPPTPNEAPPQKTLIPQTAAPQIAALQPTNVPPVTAPPRGGPPQGASSDFLLLGIGAGFSADYSGADTYDFLPTPLVIGRYKGYDFATRGPGVMVDLVRDKAGKKINYILGPIGRVRFDRNNANNIDDPQVAALEELGIAVELGATAGIKVNKIFSAFDDITVMVDTVFDVTGVHGGTIISPAIIYSTPLSEGIVVRLTGSANYGSDDFIETYSSINAANSLASGLAQFDADGGIRDIGASLLLAIDLDGDVRNGGWGIFGLGSYSRLVGDSADSPIVTQTGSPNQFFGSIGIGYSF